MKNLNVLKDDSHYHSHDNALLLICFIASIVQRTFIFYRLTHARRILLFFHSDTSS